MQPEEQTTGLWRGEYGQDLFVISPCTWCFQVLRNEWVHYISHRVCCQDHRLLQKPGIRDHQGNRHHPACRDKPAPSTSCAQTGNWTLWGQSGVNEEMSPKDTPALANCRSGYYSVNCRLGNLDICFREFGGIFRGDWMRVTQSQQTVPLGGQSWLLKAATE